MSQPRKIAVYTIALNEEKFAETWAKSVAEADYRIVADTGSTDGTVERLRALGVTVHTISIKPFRFDRAREASLALVPADADICIPLDMDEVLRPGWRDRLLAAWKDDTNRFRYTYVWSWHNGKPVHGFLADKIHARFSHYWKYPAHETLVPLRGVQQVESADARLIMEHHADETKSRAGYLPLLKLGAEEDPGNTRMAHYYGRELMFAKQYREAIAEIQRHLAMPSGWKVERAMSMLNLGWCHAALKEFVEAERWFVAAASEAGGGGWRDPWVELAQMHHDREDWRGGLWAAERALQVARHTVEMPMNNANWGARPWDLASACAWHAGHPEQSLVSLRKALELDPTSERLQRNLKWVTEHMPAPRGTPPSPPG